MFVDHAIITVQAGNGGNGAVAFKRAKGLPKGGPEGGDGGRGGDMILRADDGARTLLDYQAQHHWHAPSGEDGRGKQQFGAGAEDRVIGLPAGTQVFNNETGELLFDLRPGDRVVVARGGQGGFGNEHFKSATNQTPRTATPGEPGEKLVLRLELKLIADVGFVGMPNAGKSTLLRALTRAHPKVADYPFTTLSPQLGIAQLDPSRRLVLADIPGLIEGAAGGAGLGHDFLRHVERTGVLIHMLDAVPDAGRTPADDYKKIRAELEAYSEELANKPELIALNKADLLLDQEMIDDEVRALRRELRLGHDQRVFVISGAAGKGLDALLEAAWSILPETRTRISGWREAEPADATPRDSGGAAGDAVEPA